MDRRKHTDDELLTHYILSQYCDPEQDEVRKAFKDTTGFGMYLLGVRFQELRQSIYEAFGELLPHN